MELIKEEVNEKKDTGMELTDDELKNVVGGTIIYVESVR